jgi:Protein of unknown function (DUF2934)
MTAVLKSTKSHAPNSRADIEERIRRRAYEIYEQRGRIDGLDLDDWLQAETEIIGQRRKRKAARGATYS